MINETIGHFEEKSENKCLVLDEIDKNKKVLNKYEKVWEGIEKKLKPLIVAKILNIEKIFKIFWVWWWFATE